MTELTTGVLFLVTSLYGSGQAQGQIANIASANTDSKVVISETLTDNEIFTTRDQAVMEKYLRQVFSDDPILVEIARCESEFRQYDKDGIVVRGRVDRADIGVMQINERYHDETAKKLGLDIHTITGNVAYAKYLYEKEGTKPWSASKPCWSVGNSIAKK
jgi:transaldolase